MTRAPVDTEHEWLETDGLGGFASGTTAGIATRRYHGLLLVAEHPPADRRVLVNDAAVWLETPTGTRRFSRHRFTPDVTTDMDATQTGFESEPWPAFFYEAGGLSVKREIVALHGLPVVVVRYSFDRALADARLRIRPLLSGRDFHSLHHENPDFDFGPAQKSGERVAFRPYQGVTGVLSLANGVYRHAPEWYRRFQYDAERARGLDFVEDLASPGVFEIGLEGREATWVLGADTDAVRAFLGERSARAVAADVLTRERRRREHFRTPVERAADAYVVRRGEGKTIIAGYPWFGDWGRDTFIALRGLCLSTGRFGEALDILLAWSSVVSSGMLPNRFADRSGEEPEYNSVDAALWYVVCVGELLSADGAAVSAPDRRRLVNAVRSIVDGHLGGTRHGIRADADGLLAAGAPGVQLTWMDAKIGDWVVTPRVGKPVEIQALWLNALAVAEQLVSGQGRLLRRASEAFAGRFVDETTGALYDVVDVDHEPGKLDRSIRPNQVFAAGGLPFTVLSTEQRRRVLEVVERELWTPRGLRSLSPRDPAYVARYGGGVFERDSSYHRGTVWPWLAGPFIEAWVESRGGTPEAKRAARERFFEPLRESLVASGIGHVAEVTDGDLPHAPGGCFFQAWSVAELLRLERDVLHVGEHRSRRSA
jgi:predicted glycogen debranching enzyme